MKGHVVRDDFEDLLLAKGNDVSKVGDFVLEVRFSFVENGLFVISLLDTVDGRL